MPWQYDAGENRHKHHWKNDYAGFMWQSNKFVGKCPKTMTPSLAEKLLNEGIPFYNPRKQLICPETKQSYPNALYNIHEGVAYRALPTQPCCSYHAFPEIEFPPGIEEKLMKRARAKNCERELIKWLRKWSQEEFKR